MMIIITIINNHKNTEMGIIGTFFQNFNSAAFCKKAKLENNNNNNNKTTTITKN